VVRFPTSVDISYEETDMTATEVGMVNLRDSALTLADPRDEVTGMMVQDPQGNELGEVDGLIIDELERRVRMLIVASGGVMGIGQQKRLVPVETIIGVTDSIQVDRAHVDMQSDRAAYDPELTDFTDVYVDYGVPPFWAAPFSPVYFHHRT
jgi:sporulation protein YlmC with PRC-barrel domain